MTLIMFYGLYEDEHGDRYLLPIEDKEAQMISETEFSGQHAQSQAGK